MSRICPTCGRQLGPSGECVGCGVPKENKMGLIGALVITGIVIGMLGVMVIGFSRVVGNPFQILNKLKLKQRGIYEVTRASKNLVVLREPQETIALEQIEKLRAYFENRQFETLNSIYEKYQQDFENNFNNEYKLRDAFLVFDTTVPFYEELFASWIEHSADHYVPYLARAHYYYAKGWESRGYRWAKDTTEEQFRMMRLNFQNAVDDIRTAFAIRQNLLTAYIILIGISNATGDDAAQENRLQAAMELFPRSFLIRSQYINAIKPRWGGSYEEMENFAKAAETYANDNPHLPFLYGYIYCDQARVLSSEKRFHEAAALYSKAIAFGDCWYFYKERASVYHFYLQEPDKALADIEHSIFLRPTMDESYQLRSKIHFQKEDFISALDDLKTALILNPASSETLRWRKLAGRNLLNKGHKVFQEDLNQAIEQYKLSLMFNSQDPEAYYWRGVAYSRLSRLDLALADLEKAIELNPHHFDSYLALDYTLFQKHELDRIIEYWNRFIELEPDHPRAYLERSGTYYHKKDFVNSLRDLKKSCDLGNKEACKRYGRYKNQRAN